MVASYLTEMPCCQDRVSQQFQSRDINPGQIGVKSADERRILHSGRSAGEPDDSVNMANRFMQ